jgi:hypothetical protein
VAKIGSRVRQKSPGPSQPVFSYRWKAGSRHERKTSRGPSGSAHPCIELDN